MTTVLTKVWSPCFVMIMVGNRHVSDKKERLSRIALDDHDESIYKTCDRKEMAHGSHLLTSLIGLRKV